MTNMIFKEKLPSPEEIKKELPINNKIAEQKAKNDEAIKKIICSEDSRLLLIIGPCSADREDAVIEYIGRLRNVQEKVKDKIVIVPRIYTNKPRTTGDGYKGMLHQPDPHSSPNMKKGLLAIRNMHIKAIEQTGFSCADEMLYPENHFYLSDLLSYVAVGARSIENQQHRLTASGLDIPVGMKNPISGDLTVMMNSIHASQQPHVFSYTQFEVETKGNPLAHAVLRGSVNRHGNSIPNYHYEDLSYLMELFNHSNLKNPAVIVDTNHSNSGKMWDEQPRIAKDILHSTRHSVDIFKMVKGLMIESYLEDGCQSPDENTYGKSITDPCLGWKKTEKLIYELAELR